MTLLYVCEPAPHIPNPSGRLVRQETKLKQITNTHPIEEPQDPNHPQLQEDPGPREGLHRDHRPRQEQGPPNKGTRSSTHQDPQDHHPQDSLW